MKQHIDIIDGHAFARSEYVACPICGQTKQSRRISVRFGQIAMVAECRDCRIAFQSPRPSLEASIAYMDWRWRSTDTYVADVQSQLKRAITQMSYVRQYNTGPLNIVDFGAGAGSFVRAAIDNGWKATGIEHSDSAIARAKEYYDVDLCKKFPHQKYDVATMWDVIEHLRDLHGTLTLVAEHLNPDGFFFIETGNFESWRRLAEKDRWGLYLFDHQYYFTPSSLEQVLRRAGFENFQLLDANRGTPAITFKRFVRHPIRTPVSWLRWKNAMSRWPSHGEISIMVAVAQKCAI